MCQELDRLSYHIHRLSHFLAKQGPDGDCDAHNRNRDYLRNRSIQNLDPSIRNSQLYGDLLFPVFGSGVTSLVPQQAVNELFKR